MATTGKGFPYPASSAANNVPADIQALADAVDATPGIASMSTVTRDALGASAKWTGRVIWNLTTSTLQRYDGSSWLNVDQGTWLSYPPTLAQGASTDIAKTVTYAKYLSIGKLVICQLRLQATAAGTAGSNVTATLPVTAATSALAVGSGAYIDSGAAWYQGMTAYLASTTTVVLLRGDTTGGGAGWGADPNLAVASGDVFIASLMFEAA